VTDLPAAMGDATLWEGDITLFSGEATLARFEPGPMPPPAAPEVNALLVGMELAPGVTAGEGTEEKGD
jgi:hypothetical protein